MERRFPHVVGAIRWIAHFSIHHPIHKRKSSADDDRMPDIIHQWPDRQSIRLDHFYYTSTTTYFITAVVQDRQCILGSIKNNETRLSSIGLIVAHEWQETQRIRTNVDLDEWVIMPNHFHGIITIRGTDAGDPPDRPNKFRLRSNSLGSIMSQFKSITTKRIRTSGFPHFAWQRNYYERIIRDDEALESIRAYIRNNPAQWERDRNNTITAVH